MQTLEIARELQQAGISETSSYEMAEIINGKSGLATREDITKLEGELKNKATKEDIHEVREDITKLEGKIDNRMSKIDNRMSKIETSNKWVGSLTLMVLGTLVALLLSTVAILLKIN